ISRRLAIFRPASRAHEPVGIIAGPKRGVERPDPIKGRTTDEPGSGHDTGSGPFQELGLDPARWADPRLEEQANLTTQKVALRVVTEVAELDVELVRDPEIVLVLKGDELAASGLEARVSGRRDARVRLVKVSNFLKRARDLGASVAGAIVHDDNLEPAIG